jgi:hypothetical protein
VVSYQPREFFLRIFFLFNTSSLTRCVFDFFSVYMVIISLEKSENIITGCAWPVERDRGDEVHIYLGQLQNWSPKSNVKNGSFF